MPDQKKFASYATVTIGSLGLIASTIALTMYSSSLSPLIVGGMIGSMLPLAVCTLVGILLLNEKAESFDELSKYVVPLIAGIAGAVVSFGVGAGLVALGLESPLAIAFLAVVACKVTISLFSAITERFFSPPTPPGSSVDSDVKVDGVADNTLPNPGYC